MLPRSIEGFMESGDMICNKSEFWFSHYFSDQLTINSLTPTSFACNMITSDTKMELQYIKARFLARQYRQCIQQCEEALSAKTYSELAHHVYLNFYAALSQDSLARLMHDFSPAKIPTFTAAESRYLDALDALSKAVEERRRMNTSHLTALARQYRRSQISTTIHEALPLGCETVVEVSESGDDDDVDTESHHGFGENSSSIRRSSYQPNMSLNSSFNIVPPPAFNTDSRFDGTGRHNSATAAQQSSTFTKTSSETLLKAPSKLLPRSKSSMHLVGGLEETDDDDNPFNDNTTISPKPKSHKSPKSPIIPSNKIKNSNIRSPTTKGAETTILSSSPPFPSPCSFPLARRTTVNSTSSHLRYTSHLLALQTQLQTHISDLRRQKTGTLTAQAARSSRRAKPNLSSSSSSPSSSSSSPFSSSQNYNLLGPTNQRKSQPSLPSTRSFWSFKDSASKLAEKRQRIEDLRARGWRKKKSVVAAAAAAAAAATSNVGCGGEGEGGEGGGGGGEKGEDEGQAGLENHGLMVRRFDRQRYVRLADDAMAELEEEKEKKKGGC